MWGNFHHVNIVLLTLTVTTYGVDGRTCTNAVPGLDKMTHGIDITSFDFFDKENRGLKQPIVEFTCTNGQKKTIGETEYEQPDQVSAVTEVSGGITQSVTRVIRTYNESREALALNFEVESSVGGFGFSDSLSLRRMQDSIFKEHSYVSTVSAFESARQAQLRTRFDLPMSAAAKRYVTTYLPRSTAPPFTDYKTFIADYGTHFFQAANFGGLLLLELETKSTYYRQHGETNLRIQAKAYYSTILKASVGIEVTEEMVDEEFKEVTSETISYYGGTANLLDPDGYKRWQPTVPEKPWLFSGRLVPIYSLISNTTMRHTMENAVIDHVLRKHLEELRRILTNREESWRFGLSTLQTLHNRVKALIANTWLAGVEGNIKSLSREVLGQISIPRWFVDKTLLCYSWYNDGTGQCKGPTSRLCASPSLMPPKYQENEEGAAICPIAGNLTLKNHDTWFANKQLCFRWDQCNGGWVNEFCKTVQELTTSFRLDLGQRSSAGCRVWWKVGVTASMPVWEQNIQLCFVWRPDKPGGECGPELCAQTGNWTQFNPAQMKLLERCGGAASKGASISFHASLLLLPTLFLLCFSWLLSTQCSNYA